MEKQEKTLLITVFLTAVLTSTAIGAGMQYLVVSEQQQRIEALNQELETTRYLFWRETESIEKSISLIKNLLNATADKTKYILDHNQSIQEAINMLPRGSSIHLREGVWHQSFTINKELSVTGEGVGTVVTGDITVTGGIWGWKLDSLKRDGGNYGLYIDGAHLGLVQNVHVENCQVGIHVTVNGWNNVFVNPYLRHNERGFDIYADNQKISGGLLDHNREYGIYLGGGKFGFTVDGAEIAHSRFGLYVDHFNTVVAKRVHFGVNYINHIKLGAGNRTCTAATIEACCFEHDTSKPTLPATSIYLGTCRIVNVAGCQFWGEISSYDLDVSEDAVAVYVDQSNYLGEQKINDPHQRIVYQ